MATTSYGDITPRTAVYATRKLQKRAQENMLLERFGQTDIQGKNTGLVRKYRRYKSLAPATTPLAEGITPAGQKLTYEDVSVTLEQYGDYVELTDVIVDVHEDNKGNKLIDDTMDNCGEQVEETLELLRFEALKGGTNVFRANGVGTRAAIASPATKNDFRAIERFFRRNKAKKISKIVKASLKVATEPVAPAYFALAHSDCKPDLEDLAGFTPIEKYSDADKALPNEIGKLGSIRILDSSLFEPWLEAATAAPGQSSYLTGGANGTGSADVYPIIVLAKDAYAIVPLQGKQAVKISVLNPDKVDKSDILGQKGYVGWKTFQACLILTQSFIARLEVAASQM